jgi:hypothetical protein
MFLLHKDNEISYHHEILIQRHIQMLILHLEIQLLFLHSCFHIKYLPASIARVANKPTRKSPLIFHFSVRKFGSQL